MFILFIIVSWSISAFAAGWLISERMMPWATSKLAGEISVLKALCERQLKKAEASGLRSQILVASICAAVLGFIIVPTWPAKFMLVIPLVMLGFRIPRWWHRYLLGRRIKKFEGQFVDGLTLVANAIKSGLSLQQAFEMASLETKPPFGEELAQVLAEVRVGSSIEDALIKMEERLGLEDVKMVVQSISILRETGGNIIETFQTMTATIRERQKVHGRVRVLTTQGVVQGVIIFCMPFAMSAALYFLAPDFIMPLFTKPLGWILITLALILQTVGALVMKKIVMIKV